MIKAATLLALALGERPLESLHKEEASRHKRSHCRNVVRTHLEHRAPKRQQMQNLSPRSSGGPGPSGQPLLVRAGGHPGERPDAGHPPGRVRTNG